MKTEYMEWSDLGHSKCFLIGLQQWSHARYETLNYLKTDIWSSPVMVLEHVISKTFCPSPSVKPSTYFMSNPSTHLISNLSTYPMSNHSTHPMSNPSSQPMSKHFCPPHFEPFYPPHV